MFKVAGIFVLGLLFIPGIQARPNAASRALRHAGSTITHCAHDWQCDAAVAVIVFSVANDAASTTDFLHASSRQYYQEMNPILGPDPSNRKVWLFAGIAAAAEVSLELTAHEFGYKDSRFWRELGTWGVVGAVASEHNVAATLNYRLVAECHAARLTCR